MNTFRAGCKHNEVILMRRAMYGQMGPVHCYQDTGDFSCTSDVLAHADKMCSGRTDCAIDIPNEAFENSKPCILSVKGYFEAEYTCIGGTYSYVYKLY